MDKLRKTITKRLKLAREEKLFTQGDVAEYLGIERASYTQIELGRNMLTVDNLVKISRIFEKPVTYFLGLGEGDLTADELELVEVYRALPNGETKQTALMMLRGWLNQVQCKF